MSNLKRWPTTCRASRVEERFFYFFPRNSLKTLDSEN